MDAAKWGAVLELSAKLQNSGNPNLPKRTLLDSQEGEERLAPRSVRLERQTQSSLCKKGSSPGTQQEEGWKGSEY